MILSDLVCFCGLDTGQENHYLDDFSVFMTQNIGMITIKLKVGK